MYFTGIDYTIEIPNLTKGNIPDSEVENIDSFVK